MKNTYAGKCATCGKVVAAGDGICERGEDGRWVTRHPSRGERSCANAAAAPATPDIPPPPEWMPAQYPGRCSRCGIYEADTATLRYNRTKRLSQHTDESSCESSRAAVRDYNARNAEEKASRQAAYAAERAARVNRPLTNRKTGYCRECSDLVEIGKGRIYQTTICKDPTCPEEDHDECNTYTKWVVECLDETACAARIAIVRAADKIESDRMGVIYAAHNKIDRSLTRSITRIAPPVAGGFIWVATDLTGGTRDTYIAEPAGANPRRIILMEYRGADGDAWGEFSGGYNTHASVVAWSPELAEALRVASKIGTNAGSVMGYVDVPDDTAVFEDEDEESDDIQPLPVSEAREGQSDNGLCRPRCYSALSPVSACRCRCRGVGHGNRPHIG